MTKQYKVLAWAIIASISLWLNFYLIDKPIFPKVNQTTYSTVSGAGPGAGTYRIPKEVMALNPLDGVLKTILLLVLILSYWMVLGQVISSPGWRLTIFLISIPIAYFAFILIALLVYL